MQRAQRRLLLLGLVWYVSVLAYSQIFIYSGTRADLELEQISSSGQDLSYINFLALFPFLVAAYGVNFNYVRGAYKTILGQRRLLVFYLTISVVAVFHAIYHQDIRNILYNTLLLGIIPAFVLVWKRFSNDESSVFAALAIVLIGYLVAVPLVFGAPDDRFYGTIHPNFYGGVALTAAACISLSKKWFLRIGQLVALAGAISVSSRFAFAAILFVIGAEQILFAVARRGSAWRLWLQLGLVAVLAIYFAPNVLDLLDIDDPDRGFGAGISGRTDLWDVAIDYIFEDPLGWGFKNSFDLMSGHNGFLNLVLDFGVLPAVAIVATFIWHLWNMWNAFWAGRTRGRPDAGETSQAIAGNLFICFSALLLAGFFQPQLLNFGDPIGVLFLIILSWPGSPQSATHAASPTFLIRWRRTRGLSRGKLGASKRPNKSGAHAAKLFREIGTNSRS